MNNYINKTKKELIHDVNSLVKKVTETESSVEFFKIDKNSYIEEKEVYRLAFENVSDVIFLLNTTGNIVCVSPSVTSVLGYEAEELTGKKFSDMDCINPEHREKIMLDFEKVLCGDIVRASYEFISGDGYIKYADVNSTPLTKQGEVVGVTSIFRDITDMIHADNELQETINDIRKALGGTMHAISHILEMRDVSTANHHKRVSLLAREIATELGLPKEITDGVRIAGSLHDIGKVAIPVGILTKPGTLSPVEFSLIKTHPQIGFDILDKVQFPWPVASIVYQHHERIDGSGYPTGLDRMDILLEAKIIAVADVVEAMSSHRPYRICPGLKDALNEISMNKGTLYDSDVVDCCLYLFMERGFDFADYGVSSLDK